jgi:[acyl-carrier-protein] S-malonyltransferase
LKPPWLGEANVPLTPEQLGRVMTSSALAFRGYNSTNLGRSQELLAHGAYRPIVARHLSELSVVASETLGRKVDLVARVRAGEETTTASYGDAIALIVAMEMAQLELLQEHFGIDYRLARMSFGYSLGEIAALVAGGVLKAADAIQVPLALADDCVALSEDVTLGVLFTRAAALPMDDLERICQEVNADGQGVIGISTYLAPNSILILGQGTTLARFIERAEKVVPDRVYLRRNDQKWPPLHTPIIWERNVPNRAARLMHTLPFAFTTPHPNVLSLVTGDYGYTPNMAREILHRWVDHPQRLWDAVYATLASGADFVLHVGPAPNIIPATFSRLHDNVVAQLATSLRMRALSAAARRPWLGRLLPERAALLRAPYLQQVNLEDWLLAQSI